jgi:tetratricopeptide (TPR) repeat protein
MINNRKPLLAVLLLLIAAAAAANVRQDEGLEAARRAYETSEYAKAVQSLQAAAAKDPQNPEIHLLLAKSFFELQQYDSAIGSAEKAVSLNPRSSVYHEWLGRAYGEKAAHTGAFSALSFAKKTHKEFETAVELDGRNFAALQALIEFECSAPGIVGGGEEKARPRIERLAALDAAEGHYAAGNCRRLKRDFAAAEVEFTKALESQPKSPELIYDIGDHAMKHRQTERLLAVADAGEKADPGDPRGKFYRALGLILKRENAEEAERLLREYLKNAPRRTWYPRSSVVHEWLGRLFESQEKMQVAVSEYETAVKMDPKNKNAQEALKRLRKN